MKVFRKVLPALALLLFSATALSAVSFAWFSMNRQVTAKGLDVKVSTPSNLLIDNANLLANDRISWDNVWTESETQTVNDVSLVPASTVDGEHFFSLKDNTAVSTGNGKLIDDKSVLDDAVSSNLETVGGVFHFRYRMKSEGGNAVKVALTSLTVSDHSAAADKHSIKPVRVAIAYDTTQDQDGNPTNRVIDNLYNVTGGTNHTPGKAIAAKKSTAQTVAAVLGDVIYKTAADIPDFESLTKNTPATFEIPANTIRYVDIIVWYEGEDSECTASQAVNAKFGVEAEFSVIPNA